MPITLELLSDVNRDIVTDQTLVPKYLLLVTARDLSNWLSLKIDPANKKHPYSISTTSLIKIDPEIQRGKEREYADNLSQEGQKVREIRNQLLGHPDCHRAFLGTLVWNIRQSRNGFKKIVMPQEDGQPPKYHLAFDTDSIFLTDSAHRHFGIVEAVTEYTRKPEDYPHFSPDFSFPVELYTLDKQGESLLFDELNKKQKKITASRSQYIDRASPIGQLKAAITTYDIDHEGLFESNIEISGNTNKTTLLTMSVFMATIKEMFGQSLIEDAGKSEGLREEIAQYYCEFFYALKRSFAVKVLIDGKYIEETPFYNAHEKYIEKHYSSMADDPEQTTLLNNAILDAQKFVTQFTANDKTNSNSVIRALAKLGKSIRNWPHWQEAVVKLNDVLNAGRNSYFQVDNADLFLPTYGVAIGQKKEDGTLNIQVQTVHIKAIYDMFLEKLKLRRSPVIRWSTSDGQSSQGPTGQLLLQPGEVTQLQIEVEFFVPKSVVFDHEAVRANITNDANWPGATFQRKKALPISSIVRDEAYEDPDHPLNIEKRIARFDVAFEAASSGLGIMAIEVKTILPGFTGELETITSTIAARVG